MSRTVTVKLKTPVTSMGETITEVTVRPPTVRDRLIADKTPGSASDKELTFISNLCGLPPEVMMDLDLADYMQLQNAVNDFLS
ncbi:MAG: phage tail assembly protein [Bacteroidota bacterium]